MHRRETSSVSRFPPAPRQVRSDRRRTGAAPVPDLPPACGPAFVPDERRRTPWSGCADHQLAKIVQQAAQIGFLGIGIMSDAGELAGDAGAEQGMPPEIFQYRRRNAWPLGAGLIKRGGCGDGPDGSRTEYRKRAFQIRRARCPMAVGGRVRHRQHAGAQSRISADEPDQFLDGDGFVVACFSSFPRTAGMTGRASRSVLSNEFSETSVSGMTPDILRIGCKIPLSRTSIHPICKGYNLIYVASIFISNYHARLKI